MSTIILADTERAVMYAQRLDTVREAVKALGLMPTDGLHADIAKELHTAMTAFWITIRDLECQQCQSPAVEVLADAHESMHLCSRCVTNFERCYRCEDVRPIAEIDYEPFLVDGPRRYEHKPVCLSCRLEAR